MLLIFIIIILCLCNSDFDLEKEKEYLRVLKEKMVDGVIYMSNSIRRRNIRS